MRTSRLTNLLLTPSVLSGSISLLLSFLIIGISNWSYVSPESPLYDYLFGQYGLTTIFQQSSNAISAINGAFSSPTAYNIAVVVVAGFIGLLIYVILEGMDHISAQASDAVHQIEDVADLTAKEELKKQLEIRIGLRVAALVVWACFLIFFARVIVPYAILIGHVDFTKLQLSTVLWVSASLLLLVMSFHIHVICMRLLVLRPRLFGGDDILIEQSQH